MKIQNIFINIKLQEAPPGSPQHPRRKPSRR